MKNIAVVVGLLALSSLFASPAIAQKYPNQPVRIVVPYTAGGPVDFVGRSLQQKLQEGWGQTIVFDNRPGASAMIGSSFVARSAPDGYTLLIGGAQTHAMNVATVKVMMYDPVADFTPISQLTGTSWLLVTHPSLAVKTPSELVELIKKNPGKYSYASSGVGGVAHLGFEILSSSLGLKLQHVPYKGTSQAVNDVVAGHTPMMMGDQSTLLPHVNSGRLIAIAMTGDKRSPHTPTVPTIAESLVPGYNVQSWQGLWGPVGMDPKLAQRLNEDFKKALQTPEVVAQLRASGYEPVASSIPDFKIFIDSEIKQWTNGAKAAGIEPQ
ncbi:MAG: Bug family tripartite tricarboxylate transporter substrate binding protein [Burkholderiaceae bacterium]